MSSLFGDAVEWRASRAILAQAVVERRAKGSLTLSWILLVLASLGVLALSSDSPHRLVLFAFFTGVPLAMFFLMWWIYVCSSINTQCSPLAIRLLPAMAPRARRVTACCRTVIVLAMALVLGLPSGRPLLVAVVTGLLLLELGILGNVKRIATIIVAIVLYKYAGASMQAAVNAFALGPAAIVLGLAVLWFNGRAALRRGFDVGDWRLAPRQAMLEELADEQEAAEQSTPPAADDRSKRRIALDRLLGAAPQRQPVFLQALGPSAFGHYYFMVSLLALVCVAARGWHAWRSDMSSEQGLLVGRGLLLMVMLMLQLVLVRTEASRFERHRVEQALMRLTPAAPAMRQMNRALALFWIRGLAQMWGACSLTTLAGMPALGASWPETSRALAACTVSLLLPGMVFRDYARGAETGNFRVVFLGAYTIVACSAAGAAIADSRTELPWSSLGAGTACAGLLFAWLRWRRMLGAPPALPAMRFA